MTETEVRREILHAIIECEDYEARSPGPVVGNVAAAKLLRDAVFEALSAKGLLKIEEVAAGDAET
jgi:hypothetical protein